MRYATKRFFTNMGRRERPVYNSKLNKDGSITVTVVGFDDTQAKINSFRDSCSIDLIIQRCARGDFSGLEARQGSYLDVTQFPKTYADVLQHVIDGQNYFNSLSKEVKDKYSNDFGRWFADIGSDGWFNNMGVKPPKSADKSKREDVVKEVKKEDVVDES